MTAKEQLIEKLKHMVDLVKDDAGTSAWLHAEFDALMNDVAELKNFARSEIVRAHAPRAQILYPEGVQIVHVPESVEQIPESTDKPAASETKEEPTPETKQEAQAEDKPKAKSKAKPSAENNNE